MIQIKYILPYLLGSHIPRKHFLSQQTLLNACLPLNMYPSILWRDNNDRQNVMQCGIYRLVWRKIRKYKQCNQYSDRRRTMNEL